MDDTLKLQMGLQCEYLICHGQVHKLQIGKIMLQVAELPPQTLHSAAQKLYDSLANAQNLSLAVMADLYHSVIELFPDSWLREVLGILPIASQIQLVEREFKEIAFTAEERKALMQRLNLPVDDTSQLLQQDPDFVLRDSAVRHSGNSLLAWQLWENYLNGSYDLKDPYQHSFLLRMEANLLPYATAHLQGLKRVLIEIIKLQSELPNCFFKINASVDDCFPKEHWLATGLRSTSPEITSGARPLRETFNCYTLTGLVALEFQFLRSSKYRIKECALCGKYFIARSSRHRFCTRISPDNNGATCEELGPTKRYRESVDGDIVLKSYEKNYKAYHRWTQMAKKSLPTEGESRVEIQSEIETIFNNWCQSAQRARADYQSERISAEEALAHIKLPSVVKRSPLYFEWRPLR